MRGRTGRRQSHACDPDKIGVMNSENVTNPALRPRPRGPDGYHEIPRQPLLYSSSGTEPEKPGGGDRGAAVVGEEAWPL